MSDTASDQRLLDALESTDERTRAAAAAELHRRGHPQALEASLRTLDDVPDEAQADVTPAVLQLAGMGPAALEGLLERMVHASPMTRLRAGRAAQELSKRQHGYDGRDWPDGAYARWAEWWLQEIDYVYDAPEAERAAAVERLRAAGLGWPLRQAPQPTGR